MIFLKRFFKNLQNPLIIPKLVTLNDEKTNIVAVVSLGQSGPATESLFSGLANTILNFFLIVFGHIYSESENIIREIGALLSNSVDFTQKSFQNILQASYNTVLDAKQSCNCLDKPFQYLNKAFSKKPGNLLSSSVLLRYSYAAQAFDNCLALFDKLIQIYPRSSSKVLCQNSSHLGIPPFQWLKGL